MGDGSFKQDRLLHSFFPVLENPQTGDRLLGLCGELLLHPILGRSIKYAISLGSPEVEPPPGFREVPHRLRLDFNDISEPRNDPRSVLPAAEEIERAIAFAATVSECEGNLLVHCLAGISRSSAIALTVLAVLLGEGKEAEAMAIVMASRPQADPNPCRIGRSCLGSKG